MGNETMKPLERVEAAVALEPVDRHPVFPLIITAAPRLCGLTQAEAWRDHEAARGAMIRCCQEFGYDLSWKANYKSVQLPGKHLQAPIRMLIPGKDLAEDDLHQIEEMTLFPREHYDKIAAVGWNAYWDEHYPQLPHGEPIEQLVKRQQLVNEQYVEDARVCREQGVEVFGRVSVYSVLMALSMCRSVTEFTRDLYEVPDKVEAAMRAVCDDLIANTIEACKTLDQKAAIVVLERGSGSYYRLDVFERFEWPYLQRYVDAFVAAGITPWLHLDTDWSLNLPYFTRLPRGKCICDLDGSTDIFRANSVLGGHMCISGDVPAALLSIGTPEEVEAYCRRLIDEVGEGGGFWLTTGCECPVNVRPENLRAMVETGRTYRGKKRTRPAQTTAPAAVRVQPGPDVPRPPIAAAIGMLRHDEADRLVQQDLADGRSPVEILDDCRAGMAIVGERYSAGEYFLAELLLSAALFKRVVAEVEPRLLEHRPSSRLGTVVIGTPRGDIHDIGKNIVATLLRVGGFDVLDLGANVPPEAFVDAVAARDARVIAMSALITPTFDAMKAVVRLLEARGLRAGRFVILGGGPTTRAVQDYVGADAWTLDPQAGVELCREFVQKYDIQEVRDVRPAGALGGGD